MSSLLMKSPVPAEPASDNWKPTQIGLEFQEFLQNKGFVIIVPTSMKGDWRELEAQVLDVATRTGRGRAFKWAKKEFARQGKIIEFQESNGLMIVDIPPDYSVVQFWDT